MISQAYPLLLAGVIGITTPTAPEPTTLSIRDVSRAADAQVRVGSCVTSPIACFKLDTHIIHISRPVYRTLTSRSCRWRGPRAVATFILAHEAGHAHGIYTESGANSYAFSHFDRVARRLNFRPAVLRRALPPIGSIASTWLSRYAHRC